MTPESSDTFPSWGGHGNDSGNPTELSNDGDMDPMAEVVVGESGVDRRSPLAEDVESMNGGQFTSLFTWFKSF